MAKSKKPGGKPSGSSTANVPTTFSQTSPNRIDWVFGEIPEGDVIKWVFVQWYQLPDLSDLTGKSVEETSWLDAGGYKTFQTFNDSTDGSTWPLTPGTYQMRVAVYNGVRSISTDIKEFRGEWQEVTIA